MGVNFCTDCYKTTGTEKPVLQKLILKGEKTFHVKIKMLIRNIYDKPSK